MMPDNMYGMLVKLAEHADIPAIRAIIESYGGVVVDERVMDGLWLVAADADNFSPLMKEIDRRKDTAYTHRDKSSSFCVYAPTDYYYDGAQRPILEQIGVPAAWQITRGSQEVGGAVLDTGVDLNHPDLITNHQISLLGNDTWSLPPLHQHGTMVAGVFASHNDTGKVAGVAGGCKYMSVKCSSNGTLYDSDLIRSLQRIIDRNPVGGPKQDPWLKAINLSYGGNAYATVYGYTANSINVRGDYLDNIGVRVVVETSGNVLRAGTIVGEELIDPYGDPEYIETILTITWDYGVTPLNSQPSKVYFTAPALEEMVNTLWDMGYLFFLAAGNDNVRAVNWFYTTKGITVGSCTDTAREWYSNFGPWVDIAAPGQLMMNTAPTTNLSSLKIQFTISSVVAGSATQDITYTGSYSIQTYFLIVPITPAISGVFDEGTYITNAQSLGGTSYRITLNKPALQNYSALSVSVYRWRDYAAGDGTSFATPIVMSVALLVWSVDPTLTNQQVKDILLATATPLSPVYQLGAGKVNAAAAVQAAVKPFLPPAGRYQEAQTVTLTGTGDIYYTLDGSDPTYVDGTPPTVNGTLYTSPLTVPFSETPITLKFIAINGGVAGEVRSATYEFFLEVAFTTLALSASSALALGSMVGVQIAAFPPLALTVPATLGLGSLTGASIQDATLTPLSLDAPSTFNAGALTGVQQGVFSALTLSAPAGLSLGQMQGVEASSFTPLSLMASAVLGLGGLSSVAGTSNQIRAPDGSPAYLRDASGNIVNLFS